MVFTIGNHDNRLANTLFLGETVGSHVDRTGNVRTLGSHHRGIDAREEHLRRHIIAGDRKLYEGIAGKHDQTDLIVGEVVHQILHHHLTALQTTGDDILCPHGVTDIDGDDGLDAYALLVTDLRTQLRTGQHHDQQCQSTQQQPELHRRTEPRHIRHQFLEQRRITKLTKPFTLVSV